MLPLKSSMKASIKKQNKKTFGKAQVSAVKITAMAILLQNSSRLSVNLKKNALKHYLLPKVTELHHHCLYEVTSL